MTDSAAEPFDRDGRTCWRSKCDRCAWTHGISRFPTLTLRYTRSRCTRRWHMSESARSLPEVDQEAVADATVTGHEAYDESPQAVTYQESLLEGADPDEGFYE